MAGLCLDLTEAAAGPVAGCLAFCLGLAARSGRGVIPTCVLSPKAVDAIRSGALVTRPYRVPGDPTTAQGDPLTAAVEWAWHEAARGGLTAVDLRTSLMPPFCDGSAPVLAAGVTTWGDLCARLRGTASQVPPGSAVLVERHVDCVVSGEVAETRPGHWAVRILGTHGSIDLAKRRWGRGEGGLSAGQLGDLRRLAHHLGRRFTFTDAGPEAVRLLTVDHDHPGRAATPPSEAAANQIDLTTWTACSQPEAGARSSSSSTTTSNWASC